MSERLVDLDTTKSAAPSPTVTERVESRAERKARRAEIYERGQVGDRLRVDLPPHLYGEWVHKDDIDKKQALGFYHDKEYSRGRALHGSGDGIEYVGDVTFMVCAMEDKEILDEIRKERYDRIHAPKGGRQKEEAEFVKNVDSSVGPAIAESKSRVARKEDITAALEAAANNQPHNQ